MREDKIQTGLRIPQARYEEIGMMAQSAGVSVNTMILMLVDVGLRAINRGVEEEGRSGAHNLQHTGE